MSSHEHLNLIKFTGLSNGQFWPVSIIYLCEIPSIQSVLTKGYCRPSREIKLVTSSNSRNVDQRLVRNQTDLFNSVSVPGKDKKVDPVGNDSTETTLSTIDGRLQICHSAKNSTLKIRILDPRFFRCHCESTTEDSRSFVSTTIDGGGRVLFPLLSNWTINWFTQQLGPVWWLAVGNHKLWRLREIRFRQNIVTAYDTHLHL